MRRFNDNSKNLSKPLIKRDEKCLSSNRQEVTSIQRSIIFLNNLETQECFLISMFFVVMRLKRTENAGGFIGYASFRLKICFKFIKYSLMIQFLPNDFTKSTSHMGRYLSTLCLTVTHLFMPTNLPSLS